ncbi:MAG: winged helix DNA-binding domain-containing protein, partial [Jatrophihabitantaceae bacterium]
SRLREFGPDQLTELLLARKVVRIALMRSTLQLVSARDCLQLRAILASDLIRLLPRALRDGPDLAAIGQLARQHLEQRPTSFAELGPVLAARFPELAAADLNRIARSVLALVQVPPRGVWGRSGTAAHTTAEHWLDARLPEPGKPDELVRRYLRAFGPASVADLTAWSGMAGLGAVVRRLQPELACYRSERGQRLFDVSDGLLPDPATVPPVRIIAEFDNLLLAHSDRARIFADEQRARIITTNGLVSSTFLIDGFVAGTCRLRREPGRATLSVTPFATLRRAHRRALLAEADRWLAFATPDSSRSEIQFVE